MYFCDLDKLKLTRTYRFQTYGTELHVSDLASLPASELQKQLQTVIDKAITDATQAAIEPCLQITLSDDAQTPMDVETFTSIVNMVMLVFSELNATSAGRKREHRLGVPDKLAVLHMSQNLLKEMVNSKTRLDVFNIQVLYRDLVFDLCQPGEEDND